VELASSTESSAEISCRRLSPRVHGTYPFSIFWERSSLKNDSVMQSGSSDRHRPSMDVEHDCLLHKYPIIVRIEREDIQSSVDVKELMHTMWKRGNPTVTG
jgi:hypothetical protein